MDAATGETALLLPPVVEAVRRRVDEVLAAEFRDRRTELAAFDPEAEILVDELERLVGAGGKRLRPAFCYLGFRAAGGPDDEPIIRAAAALELLHTFALVHDDVMDEAAVRRGVETTRVRFSRESTERHGRSVAVLVGDLAAVLAESLFRSAGFPPERTGVALVRFDRMRLEMAAGQYLDLVGAARRNLEAAEHVAELKTGSYTIEGPLLIGAVLAGAPPEVQACLSSYARPAGEAFQLRDDVLDHEAIAGAAERVNVLIGEAVDSLRGPRLEPVAASALRSLAEALRLSED
jgi:geranylgeranyl diphosphate synthase type I